MLGVVLSKESLLASYVFQFAFLMAVMTNTTFYFFRKSWFLTHKKNVVDARLPTILMTLATICIGIGPLKNLCVNLCMQAFKETQPEMDHLAEVLLDF